MAAELFEAVSQAPDTGGPNRCVISGLSTRKSRNMARDARCALTVSTHRFDLAVEGAARIVTDRARLERIAQA